MRPTNVYGHISAPNGPRLNPAYTSNMGHTISSFQAPPDNNGLSNTASQRQQGRLSQILDVDVFGGAGSLARSTSLSGVSRARHGNQPPDDVERAFVDLSPSSSRIAAAPQQSSSPQSFYNSSITYQGPSSNAGDPGRVPANEQLPYPTRRTTNQQISQPGTSPVVLKFQVLRMCISTLSISKKVLIMTRTILPRPPLMMRMAPGRTRTAAHICTLHLRPH